MTSRTKDDDDSHQIRQQLIFHSDAWSLPLCNKNTGTAPSFTPDRPQYRIAPNRHVVHVCRIIIIIFAEANEDTRSRVADTRTHTRTHAHTCHICQTWGHDKHALASTHSHAHTHSPTHWKRKICVAGQINHRNTHALLTRLPTRSSAIRSADADALRTLSNHLNSSPAGVVLPKRQVRPYNYVRII